MADIPHGICHCGCGQPTPLATRTRADRGQIKGEPLRYRHGHYRPPTGPRAIPTACDPATLTMCRGPFCGEMMHRTKRARLCSGGHQPHDGRGLCSPCHRRAVADGTIVDYPRMLRPADEVLDEWDEMSRSGVRYVDFPARIGMSFGAWERAFQRARQRGDERAVRRDRAVA